MFEDAKDTSLWWRSKKVSLRFNPVVTFFSLIFIWFFVAYCVLIEDALNTFVEIKKFLTLHYSWLYIGTKDIWVVFLIVVYFKFGSTKLGKDDDEPEFSFATWFSMMFSCGMGVGMFFFGVAEPIWHYDPIGGGNRFISDPSIPDNALAQEAINITFYHWGIHAWIVYVLIGLILGIISHRHGLPMSIKSCFYPLIGNRIFGWIGDFVDILAVITTMFGVCTSLGLGAIQLNAGLSIVFDSIPASVNVQVVLIWCITSIATISTATGLTFGIRRLSELCFAIGVLLMLLVILMDNTSFLLNLFVQSIGYYIQWIIQLGWHTDAFEQLGPSYGASDRNRVVYSHVENTDGPSSWMNDWTIFYWGWWISWSPFVGMFIAKVSRGRTIRQFINGAMTAPIFYTFLWLTIFGGAGLHMEREAAGQGLCCSNNINSEVIKNLSIVKPDEIVNSSYSMLCGDNKCDDCANNALNNYKDFTYSQFKKSMEGGEFNVKSRNGRLTRLSCQKKEDMFFNLVGSYGDLGGFLKILTLIGIAFYFITSSDSGSLVIDTISANGDDDPPVIQRISWALMEGVTATALLLAGGNNGLTSVQSIAIIAGFPFTIVMCVMCLSLWKALDSNTSIKNAFQHDLLEPLSHSNSIYQLPDIFGSLWIIVYIFFGPFFIGKYGKKRINYSNLLQIYVSGILLECVFVCAIFLYLFQWLLFDGAWAVAIILYLLVAFFMAMIRSDYRESANIEGSYLYDFFIAACAYPFLALQLQRELFGKLKQNTTSPNI